MISLKIQKLLSNYKKTSLFVSFQKQVNSLSGNFTRGDIPKKDRKF